MRLGRLQICAILVLVTMQLASAAVAKKAAGKVKYHDCGSDCVKGFCNFKDCDKPACKGGVCHFLKCTNPTCAGGGCTFDNCPGATCTGAGCNFVNHPETLGEGYCSGKCKVEGMPFPTFKGDYLTI